MALILIKAGPVGSPHHPRDATEETEMDKKLAALADEIEAALQLEQELAERAVATINAMTRTQAFTTSDLDSTDKVLSLIYAVKPGWSVNARGKARMPNGHWRCTLRKSSSRDNDEFIGIGRGPTLPHSLLASLLRVQALDPS